MNGRRGCLIVRAPPAPRRSRVAACRRASAAALASVPAPDLSQRMLRLRFSAAPAVRNTEKMSRILAGTFRSSAGDCQFGTATLNSISPDCEKRTANIWSPCTACISYMQMLINNLLAHHRASTNQKTTPTHSTNWHIGLISLDFRRSNPAMPVEKQASKSHLAEPQSVK